MKYQIIRNRKYYLLFSSILLTVSIFALIVFGFNFGIDFTGGSLLEMQFNQTKRPSVEESQNILADLALDSLVIQPVGDDGLILKFQEVNEDKHQEILSKFKQFASENAEENIDNTSTTTSATTSQAVVVNLEELRFDSIGPSIGQELKRKSFSAMIMVLIAIVIYVAWAFRKVSKPVQSWKYGITAIIALFHDCLIVLGVFAFLGKFYGIEINTPFIAAILTVLGYSVNDTIVVFDRIRENLLQSNEDFSDVVNTSVNQTFTRSINTSLTTLFVLLSILFFGGESIRDFVLALSIGVFIGTYSSIFLASPILVVWKKLGEK